MPPPLLWLPLSLCSPYGLALPYDKKSSSPEYFELLKTKMPPSLKGGWGREDIIKVDEKRRKSANKSQHGQFHKLSWYK